MRATLMQQYLILLLLFFSVSTQWRVVCHPSKTKERRKGAGFYIRFYRYTGANVMSDVQRVRVHARAASLPSCGGLYVRPT